MGKTGRDAGGTWKEPMEVSMVLAWWTENVDNWAKQQLSMIVDAKIGRILRTDLTSSIWVWEQLKIDGIWGF